MKYRAWLTCLLIVSTAKATIINVPADSTTIQAGIDGVSDGDTILVQPGTYVENINFNGKNIVVGSLFLTTGDTTFISSTIIDGDSSGSVVTFENGEDSTATLIGFSIINGMNVRGGGISCSSSSPRLINLRIRNNRADYGGGLRCSYSSPLMENLIVSENTAAWGGGISCKKSNPRLMNLRIRNNRADYGGGLNCAFSSPLLENLIISENTADRGGGINCVDDSYPVLSGVTVRNNTVSDKGGGIYCSVFSYPRFNVETRSNIYRNHAHLGSDLYVYLRQMESPIIAVVLDTFTVMVPTDYYASPNDIFTFDILHAKIEQVDADLYVSPSGDNTNSGQTPEESLQTISYAQSILLADSLHPHKIHLSEGVYSPSATGEVFPLSAVSYVSLSGASENGTVLDAEGQSSVIVFYRAPGSVLETLTITGGLANNGGGIYCRYSSPRLTNVTVSGNTAADDGGGIYCFCNSSPDLTNVTVIGNTAGVGGGLSCYDSSPSLVNVTLSENIAISGGGISLLGSNPSFSQVTLCGNSAESHGGGISLVDSHPSFDVENRSNIYLNQALRGNDLYAHYPPPLSPSVVVVLDTFTVMYPNEYYVWPINYFIFDILNTKIDQPTGHLYVSPEGDDTNSGQTPSESLRTVAYAQSIIRTDADNPATIQLAEGRYSPSMTGEVFPITMISYINLVGAPEGGTILDAEGGDRVVYLLNNLGRVSIRNLTITGGCRAGIACAYSDLDLVNVTISGNGATDKGVGLSSGQSNLRLVNAILWNNYPVQIRFVSEYPAPPNSLVIANSNIQGGEDSIIASSIYMVEWLESNIASDPLFVDAAMGNFHLQEGSPCIDAGTSLFIWEGDTLVNLPDSAYKGNAPDMGACESPYIMQVSEYEIMPTEFALHQNYPNPFNPISTIRYDLPQASDVSLVVYDILGREVARLVDQAIAAGYHEIVWNGRDHTGLELPSGIYIVRLMTPEYSESIKTLLLK